jgi:TPP-dependent pyruvate/acetoin dehydrogenase alpha subunit
VIVENNGYAYSTPVSRQTAAKSFVDKAPAYGVIGDRCDGNDVMAVYGKVRSVAERVRAGEGPALLEMMTYRRLGHAEHDNQHYVPAGEIESWEARDPIARFEQTIRQHGWLEEAALAEARAKAKAVIDEAREEAESSPMPDAAEAMTPVVEGLPIEAPWTRRKEPDPHRN